MKTYLKSRLVTVSSLLLLVVACGDGTTSDGGGKPEPPITISSTSGAIDFCEGSKATIFITEDKTLSNHSVGTDYSITCNVEFRDGTLAIEKGAEIIFDSSTGITMTGNSVIRVLGGYDGEQRAEPAIVLKGNSVSGQPSWNGLFINSGSVDNYLENVHILDAGFQSISGILYNQGPSALLLDNRVTIKGLTIDNSGGHGIYTGGGVDFGQMQDVVIGDTVDHPIIMPTHIAGTQLAENKGTVFFTSSETDNFQSIGVFDNLLSNARLGGRTSFTFENHGIPYYSYDGFFGNGEIPMVMNSGVEFIMSAGKGIKSGGGSGARFTIAGTVAEPVKFRGAETFAGFWPGLQYGSNTVLNTVDHVVIEDAINGIFANANLTNVQLSVNDAVISNTSECAIRSTNPSFRSVTLSTSNNVYINNGVGDMNDPLCLGNFEE